MRKIIVASVLGLIICSLAMCRKPEPLADAQYDERMSGGSQTTFDATSKAFGHPFEGLGAFDEHMHALGDAQFGQTFVTAPAPINPGLGPAFNNTSCTSCHHNDGIGLPTTGTSQSSLLMRISMPGMTDEHGGPMPVEGYGTQLQDKAIFGKVPECNVVINYSYQDYLLPGGESYQLQTPTYTLTNMYLGGSPSAYWISPRLAPPVFGLGLLEAISDATILSYADVNDANGDGISGKPNYVWDPYNNRMMLGRFGLKANTATIMTQVAAAYNNDMGITNNVFPLETVHGQSQMDEHSGKTVELADTLLNSVRFYIQSLQVPARRNVTDPDVVKGKKIFNDAKCVSCHIPTIETGVNVAFKEVSGQTIHPYTDLLVHDMGIGLSDNRNDYDATGNEWRTAPLWGLGLFEKVNYPAYYLHDGRARTITEAIMWHGGEALKAKQYVEQLSKEDRDALLKFLKSL